MKATTPFTNLSNKLKSASEPNRLHILCLLFGHQKMCVSDISKKLKLSVAVVSHHLLALQKEELVSSVREGKKICYSLSESNFMRDFRDLICKYK